MTNEETIFAEALQKPSAEEREAYLDQACAGNVQVRRDVQALLLAHERAGGILEASPLEVETIGSAPPPSEGVGATVGPYKLLEQIGGGGMGVVYMAEQLRPIRRKVALKIIKPGMDSAQIIARFEAERQALTMMEHPNIAKVLDAGTTDAGRPYFVMELVKGIPITDYCDQARLNMRQRLELFVHVCQAVQHAHQKGVIHRDLKPSNVLVTLHDEKPVPKVIDFGIAKATGQLLTDKTLFTNYAQMLGTPLYMSPEQAQISGVDVDTRSDIYALGVLLYELLTGTTPFDKQRLREAAYDEMQRIIREEEPPKPSTRLSALGEKITAISADRQTDPKHLSQLVHGDLDSIVMKALEKDRSRRYEAANGFGADVRRYLAGERVLAVPPSAGYRLKKFSRKNRVALTTAGLVAATLILGTTLAIWQAVRATREAARATAAEAEAVAERKKAVDLASRLRESVAVTGQAYLYLQQHRWSSAHAALAKAQELNPDLLQIYVFRRWMYEGLGLWERAADDGAKIDVLMDGTILRSHDWYQYALLRLHVGDETGYRDACRRMLRRFEGGTDEEIINMVRACVLTDRPVIDSIELVRRFEGATASEKVNWRLYLAGLAQYRAGQFDQAIGSCKEALTLEPYWPARDITYPVLAMAYHRLGKAGEAKKALDSAEKALDKWTEEMLEGPVGEMPIPWFDWLEFRHCFHEAKELVTGTPPPDDPRLRLIRERALAALSSER